MQVTKINRDANGNPRFVVHFYSLLNNKEMQCLSVDEGYELALKKAKKIGGKKISQ